MMNGTVSGNIGTYQPIEAVTCWLIRQSKELESTTLQRYEQSFSDTQKVGVGVVRSSIGVAGDKRTLISYLTVHTHAL